MKRLLMWSFDVETTGLSAIYNDLIQVAASKMYKAMSLRSLMSLSIQAILVSLFTTQLDRDYQ